jgi:hypothetical protein
MLTPAYAGLIFMEMRIPRCIGGGLKDIGQKQGNLLAPKNRNLSRLKLTAAVAQAHHIRRQPLAFEIEWQTYGCPGGVTGPDKISENR